MKRHRFDPLSFLLGAALLVVALPFLLSGDFPVIRPSRIWPLAVIGVGIVLGGWALASVLGSRSRPVPDRDLPPPARPE
ncbi:MAG: hypothetical protein ACJ76P_13385 [Actinomycetota bacterium]